MRRLDDRKAEFFLKVCDVGAGYTTLLSSDASHALVDFGAKRGATAVDALRRCDDWWWPPYGDAPFEVFVLSHPHLDHYSGLLEYARRQEQGIDLPHPLFGHGAIFHHPRLPDDSESKELLFRLAALESLVSGIPDFAVARAIAACSASSVERVPLWRGDRFILAGQECEALWPPEMLPPRARAGLRTLITRYDELATELAEQGDRRLHEELNRIREASTIDPESAIYGQADSLEPMGDSPRPYAEEHPEQSLAESAVRSLRTAIADGANLLSLVFTTADRRYVFLGDLDHSLHGEIVADLISYTPEVVLSAHHGTHFGPQLSTVTSRYVISSVGDTLSKNVRPDYGSMGMHLRTDEAGDIGAEIGKTATRVWAGFPGNSG